MKAVFALLLLALLGCAGGKPKNYDRECKALFARMDYFQEMFVLKRGRKIEALFARIDDFQERFQGTEREKEFAARYEISTKMVFPIELEDGTIVNCREKITCDGTDYCIILEYNGEWGGFIL